MACLVSGGSTRWRRLTLACAVNCGGQQSSKVSLQEVKEERLARYATTKRSHDVCNLPKPIKSESESQPRVGAVMIDGGCGKER